MSIVIHKAAFTAAGEPVSLHPVTPAEARRLAAAKQGGRIHAAACCTACLDGRLFRTVTEAHRWGSRHHCRPKVPVGKPRRKRWTLEHDRILRNNPDVAADKLAPLLGFGATTIRNRRATLAMRTRVVHIWTPEETAFLEANPHLSHAEVAAELGLDKDRVRRRRARLRRRAQEASGE